MKMRVVSLTTVAFMATKVHSFTSPSWSFKPETLQSRSIQRTTLWSTSYDKELETYYKGKAADGSSFAFQQVPPVNGVPSQSQPEGVAQSGEDIQFDGLISGAVAFVGLPLWILLTVQVFGGGSLLTPPTSTSTTPSATEITLPASAPKMEVPSTSNDMAVPAIEAVAGSDAKPAGVVVVSQPITKAEVRALFNLWNDALQTGDPATVAQRYAKDGVLLPTLSDRPRNDFEAIKDYFVGFLKKKPNGKILQGEIFVGNNWAQDAGIYEFTFQDGSKVKARYSFIYVYEDGKWMISHHHSSLMPEETVRPTPITKEEVRKLFDLWNNALATGDPQKVAARYTQDAVLLPTLSDSARYTNDRVADYFVGFLKKKPDGKILEGNIKTGPNWAQDAGIYEFSFEDGSKVKGRYSFVYAYENGEWKIAHHHSSIMPEGAVAAIQKVAKMEKAIAAMQQ